MLWANLNYRNNGFTLVELIATTAILAILVVGALVFIPGYINWSKQVSDQRTLTVLNDALTRYKCGGGDINALTLGAPIDNIITRLQTPVTWGGTGNNITHQFLKNSFTIPGRSLLAVGEKAQYRFAKYNTSSGEHLTVGTPTNQFPYGEGVGYMSNGGAQAYTITIYCSGATTYAVKDASGSIQYYAPSDPRNVGTSQSITFWACKANGDPTPQGSITNLTCSSNQLTQLDVKGLSALTDLRFQSNSVSSIDLSGCPLLNRLQCENNQLTSIDISKNPLLVTFYCNNNLLPSLNVSGHSSLVNFIFGGNLLTSVNASNCTSLVSFIYRGDGSDGSTKLTSLNITGCSSLTTLRVYANLLASIDITGCDSLSLFQCGDNSLNASALNDIYSKLPDRSSTTAGSITVTGNSGVSGDDPSLATAKNWTITG